MQIYMHMGKPCEGGRGWGCCSGSAQAGRLNRGLAGLMRGGCGRLAGWSARRGAAWKDGGKGSGRRRLLCAGLAMGYGDGVNWGWGKEPAIAS